MSAGELHCQDPERFRESPSPERDKQRELEGRDQPCVWFNSGFDSGFSAPPRMIPISNIVHNPIPVKEVEGDSSLEIFSRNKS